VLLCHS
jgi:RNA polymerase sigma-70 factor, ECF subfamily